MTAQAYPVRAHHGGPSARPASMPARSGEQNSHYAPDWDDESYDDGHDGENTGAFRPVSMFQASIIVALAIALGLVTSMLRLNKLVSAVVLLAFLGAVGFYFLRRPGADEEEQWEDENMGYGDDQPWRRDGRGAPAASSYSGAYGTPESYGDPGYGAAPATGGWSNEQRSWGDAPYSSPSTGSYGGAPAYGSPPSTGYGPSGSYGEPTYGSDSTYGGAPTYGSAPPTYGNPATGSWGQAASWPTPEPPATYGGQSAEPRRGYGDAPSFDAPGYSSTGSWSPGTGSWGASPPSPSDAYSRPPSQQMNPVPYPPTGGWSNSTTGHDWRDEPQNQGWNPSPSTGMRSAPEPTYGSQGGYGAQPGRHETPSWSAYEQPHHGYGQQGYDADFGGPVTPGGPSPLYDAVSRNVGFDPSSYDSPSTWSGRQTPTYDSTYGQDYRSGQGASQYGQASWETPSSPSTGFRSRSERRAAESGQQPYASDPRHGYGDPSLTSWGQEPGYGRPEYGYGAYPEQGAAPWGEQQRGYDPDPQSRRRAPWQR